MYYFDPLYMIMLAPVLLFSFWASYKVKSTFKYYSKYGSKNGITGAQTARKILESNGITNVPVEKVRGKLTDHYSPREKVLRLSEEVYDSTSISAIGVAAHEAGHAIQHAKSYSIMGLWQMLAKPATISSNIAIWIIFLGYILSSINVSIAGVVIFSIVVLFQLVTLPLEYNASSRAKRLIVQNGILDNVEINGVAKVLNSAALTYVAAAVASIVTLLYYLIRLGLLSSDN